MTLARVSLFALGLAFVAAEIVRPTVVHRKLIASHALLLVSQASAQAQTGTLGSELLLDLPRIRPDSRATLARAPSRALRVAGTVVDPATGRPGSAVFPILDGRRVLHFAASYAGGRYAIVLNRSDLAAGRHRLAVGLVTTDQRGYVRSARTLTVDERAARRR